MATHTAALSTQHGIGRANRLRHSQADDLWARRTEEGGREASGTMTLSSRFVSGDAGAVSELYKMYARPALAVAYRVLHDRGPAEEAVQQTFLNAWRAASRFDPDLVLVVCRGFGLVGEGGLASVDLGDGVVGGLVP